MRHVIADGSTDEPAEFARVKFKGRAVEFFMVWTLTYLPTIPGATLLVDFAAEQKNKLSLHMTGDGTPALLITAHSFKRYPKQVGKVFLGLFQSFSASDEFFSLHNITGKR